MIIMINKLKIDLLKRVYLFRIHTVPKSCNKTTKATVFDKNNFKSKFDYSYIPKVLRDIEGEWKGYVNTYWKSIIDKQNGTNQKKKYVLSMFPYPSGNLHLGHIRIYTTSDILFKTSVLCGENTIHPMGFDSFGLPAENAAKLNNLNPFIWTQSNIEQMKSQLNQMNYHFHWRESTSDPSYYRWTQWLFIQLFNSGLAYQGVSQVNWDPVDCTVLADEQVDSDGKSWRSGAQVVKRFHKQWLIKTNAFADQLYNGDDILDTGHWSFILANQRWWIKQPNGYLFYLKLACQQQQSENVLQIFTKYPELFKSSKCFVGISKKHWLANGKYSNDLVGTVPNPFLHNKPMDIRVVDNDQIPSSTQATIYVYRELFEDDNIRREVLSAATEMGIGGYFTSNTYRDWLISRQRYWGTPIPIVHCPQCGPVVANEKNLPIQLPDIDYSKISSFKSQEVSSPLKNFAPDEWLKVDCPKCNSDKAIRETDTFDTFFDSSWYFLRYFSEPSQNDPFNRTNLKPVYCYVGGKEHASLHLFYARFITHFLNSQGHINFKEPFRTLLMQAIVKARTYKLNGKYISEEEAKDNPNVEINFEKMSKSKGTGINPNDLIDIYGSDAVRWTLISVGNPESERLWDNNEKEFGPTLVFFHRLLLTIEEFQAAKHERLKLKILDEITYKSNLSKLTSAIDHSVFNVQYSLCSSYQIRNGTSSIHKLINALRSNISNNIVLSAEFERGLASLLVMLSPFVPCFSAECWQAFSSNLENNDYHTKCGFNFRKTVCEQPWPKIVNPEFLYIIRFTRRGENGREEECGRVRIPLKHLGSWNENEIRDLFNIPEEEIEWIDIVKNCSVVIRVKNYEAIQKILQESQFMKQANNNVNIFSFEY